MELSLLPDWIGSPLKDQSYILRDVKIPEDLDTSISTIILNSKRRKMLIEKMLHLFSTSMLPGDDFERVLGVGTSQCSDQERIVWMTYVKEILPLSESPLSQIRYAKLLSNPDFFIL